MVADRREDRQTGRQAENQSQLPPTPAPTHRGPASTTQASRRTRGRGDSKVGRRRWPSLLKRDWEGRRGLLTGSVRCDGPGRRPAPEGTVSMRRCRRGRGMQNPILLRNRKTQKLSRLCQMVVCERRPRLDSRLPTWNTRPAGPPRRARDLGLRGGVEDGLAEQHVRRLRHVEAVGPARANRAALALWTTRLAL